MASGSSKRGAGSALITPKKVGSCTHMVLFDTWFVRVVLGRKVWDFMLVRFGHHGNDGTDSPRWVLALTRPLYAEALCATFVCASYPLCLSPLLLSDCGGIQG